MCSIFKLVIFAIMTKNYIVLIMNVNQIKVKLKSSEYILTEKDKLKVKYGNHFMAYKMQLLRRKIVLFIE
jgi:hypothetical protein